MDAKDKITASLDKLDSLLKKMNKNAKDANRVLEEDNEHRINQEFERIILQSS